MKSLLLACLSLLLLTSCAPTVSQLVTLKSDNLKSDPRQGFVYDNDTLRLSYQFFAERGLIHFAIENKLNKPLYVDWKRSSFIIGQNKLDYWYDVANINLYGTAYTSTYGRYFRNSSSGYGSFSLNGTVRKDNAIDYIPPGTKLERDQFILVPGNALSLPGQFTVAKVPSTVPDEKKPADVQVYHYTTTDSPLTFRNYLTLGTDKDFNHEIVIDSKFWAADVQVMARKQFLGNAYEFEANEPGTVGSRTLPYYRPDAFFINYTPESANSMSSSPR
ncbi:hypothetical protein J2I47_24930 [Fibrella sp. HMF5335]|uniref:DKNYY family protein n=1 Tax=Fibrella rubiginis TaxID=2817060 RepID=A0A939GIQ6_9BACT|nr:hypothetical protein [Fibrella rubiginis]MBO0939814.1 hypothetical protein [Fibrella rubiginis]